MLRFLSIFLLFSMANGALICDSNRQCRNGGICSAVVKSDGKLASECRCPPAFHGLLCEFQRCPQDPCQNGGVCDFGARDFKCHCSNGFSGKFCEIRSGPDCFCNGHGTCLEVGLNNFECRCNAGFTGRDCSRVLTSPCRDASVCGHGQCLSMLGPEPVCRCQPGWTGKRCLEDVNECQTTASSDSLCGAHGLCVNEPGNFRCECKNGFSGQFCTEEPKSAVPLATTRFDPNIIGLLLIASGIFLALVLSCCLWLLCRYRRAGVYNVRKQHHQNSYPSSVVCDSNLSRDSSSGDVSVPAVIQT